jgi:bis(5'-nucleosyl)-tetraphosphatase (symmetrical)
MVDWLRHQPLAHAEAKTLMVHAGVLPSWTATKTLDLAREVERRLQSDHWQDFLHEMYGNSPGHWKDGLRGRARHRMVVNVLTRLRYLRPDGSLDYKCKLSPSIRPSELQPWFASAQRSTRRHRIVFGHWSTLGLLRAPGLLGIDTGCAWGGYLTAVRLEDEAIFQQSALESWG